MNHNDNNDNDDDSKTQKYYKLLEESFTSELERCEYFVGCMLHPEFLRKFDDPSIFITSTETFHYVIKTCGYTFEDVPVTLLLGYYFGYIHYQLIFHQRKSHKLVQLQRSILESILPCITTELTKHNTTRYTKTWGVRFMETSNNFQMIVEKLVHDLQNRKISMEKYGEYIQKSLNNAFIVMSNFIIILSLSSKLQWMISMKQCIDVLRCSNSYEHIEIRRLLSLYFFATCDALNDVSYEKFERIMSRVGHDDTDVILQLHEEYLENSEELMDKLTKPKTTHRGGKKNKKKKKKANVDVEDVVVEDVVDPIETKDLSYYYDESNDLVDLYNTLSYLEL
jgi:hypothetical protein